MRKSQLARDRKPERASVQNKQRTESQSGRNGTETRHERTPFHTLQQEIGNRAVQELVKTGRVRPKQRIGFVNDSAEREANRVRQQVMRAIDAQLQRSCPCQGECSGGQTRNQSQAPKHHQHDDLGQDVSHKGSIRDARERQADRVKKQELRVMHPGKPYPPMSRSGGSPGKGKSLDDAVLGPMQAFFDRDLSNVRIHTDRQTATSAEAMNANAYTIGHEIFFGRGQYAPNTNRGLGLLAHELTHVVQQSRGDERVQFDRDRTGNVRTNENEAEASDRPFIERVFAIYWRVISPVERYLVIQNELEPFQRIDPLNRLNSYMEWCAEVYGVRETDEGTVDSCLHCETTEDFWGREREECHYPYDRGAPFFFRDEEELRKAEDKARERVEQRRRRAGIPQEEFIRRGKKIKTEWHLGVIQNSIMGFTRVVGPAWSLASSAYDAYNCVHHGDEESCAKAGQSFLSNFTKGMLKR